MAKGDREITPGPGQAGPPAARGRNGRIAAIPTTQYQVNYPGEGASETPAWTMKKARNQNDLALFNDIVWKNRYSDANHDAAQLAHSGKCVNRRKNSNSSKMEFLT